MNESDKMADEPNGRGLNMYRVWGELPFSSHFHDIEAPTAADAIVLFELNYCVIHGGRGTTKAGRVDCLRGKT